MSSPLRRSTMTNWSLPAVRRLVSAAGECGRLQTSPSPGGAGGRRRRGAPPGSMPSSPKYVSSGRGERPLVGGRLQVTGGDVRVVEVDDGLFDAAREQQLRLVHEVLVERVLAGHEHGPAVPLAAGPAPALAEAGHRSREPGDQRDVEAADVDAELERLCGDDGVELVREQASLDVAALLRRVAGPVRHDARRGAAGVAVLQAAAHVAVHQLRRLARGRERDDPRSCQHALGRHVARLRERAAPRARGGVFERRVPEHHRALRPRGLVLVDRREGEADEPLGERLRLGDGGRGEHEAGVAAVVRAEAPQAADHLRDVAAEDPAVHVGLVEHDVAQVVQELGPALVARQDAEVQHVRVAEQDGGAAPDAGAHVHRGVAVVDGRDGGAEAAAPEAAGRRRMSPASLRAWSCASALVGKRSSARHCGSRA